MRPGSQEEGERNSPKRCNIKGGADGGDELERIAVSHCFSWARLQPFYESGCAAIVCPALTPWPSPASGRGRTAKRCVRGRWTARLKVAGRPLIRNIRPTR